MIWLVWRQFRTQALVVAGLLVVPGHRSRDQLEPISLHLYDTTVATCAQHNDCVSARARFQAQAKWHNALEPLGAGGPGPPRRLLGRTARRPRDREPHEPPGLDPERDEIPVVAGQGRRHGRGKCDHSGPAQPHGDLVGIAT